MKYPSPPTQKDLLGAYNLIQSKRLTAKKFMEIFEWSRFDPRLAEILVLSLRDHWSDWNPFEINHLLQKSHSPLILKVLGAHVTLLLKGQDRKVFNSWMECCFYKVEATADWSLFYIGQFNFGSSLLKEEAFESIPLFTNWGYYGKTPMIDFSMDSKVSQKTLVPKPERIKKLKQLLSRKKQIRVHDYMALLENKISRRMAELDIKEFARKSGNTKSSTYRK